MLINIMDFKGLAVLIVVRDLFDKYAREGTEHDEGQKLAVEYMERTKQWEGQKKFNPITVNAHEILKREYMAYIATLEKGQEYMPSLIGAEMLENWFYSDHPLITIPECLRGWNFQRVLEISHDLYGYDQKVKESKRLADRMVKLLLNTSVVKREKKKGK